MGHFAEHELSIQYIKLGLGGLLATGRVLVVPQTSRGLEIFFLLNIKHVEESSSIATCQAFSTW